MKPFWTLRAVSQSFLAPQDCETRGKTYLEVRKPSLWGRSPELPLMDCTSMFAFLGPILGKGLRENLCHCSLHWGVIPGNCWAKECVSWRTEDSSCWFAPCLNSFWHLVTDLRMSELCADVDIVQHVDFPWQNVRWKEMILPWIPGTCCHSPGILQQPSYSSSCSLSAFQVPFLRADPLKNTGLIIFFPCEIPSVTPNSLRKKSEPLSLALKTIPGLGLSLQLYFPPFPV